MDMGESDEKFPRQKVNENGLDTRYARPFHFLNGLRRHHKAFQKSSTWNHCDPHAPIQQISNRVHHPHPPFPQLSHFPQSPLVHGEICVGLNQSIDLA